MILVNIYGKSLIATLTMSMILAGCSHKTDGLKVPPAIPLRISIKASNSINTNIDMQASPLVITVFQLQSKPLFMASTYEKLSTAPNEELKDSLVDQSQYEIRPGERAQLDQTLMPETNFLGVIAGYRVLNNAKWRVIVPITDRKKIKYMEIRAEEQRILIQQDSGEVKDGKL